MSTSGIVIHYTGRGFPSANPWEIVLNGNFVFDLHNIFQECKLGIKRDLPIQITINNDHYKYEDLDAVDIVMLTYLLFIFKKYMKTGGGGGGLGWGIC
jgi:hypothetical protein